MNQSANIKKGILCIILSAFCFSLMNLFIRLAGDVPTLQKCFFRNLFALFVALAAMRRAKVPFKIGEGNLKYLLGRSLCGCLGMMCNFYAVDKLALSDASMLNKLSPFFAVIFSALLLGEVASRYDWFAIAVAFIGMLFVVKPTFSMEAIPAVAGVLGGLGAGIAYTFVRRLSSRKESPMVIVAFFSGFSTLFLIPFLIATYKAPSSLQWLFLILTGITAAGGQVCITKAYSYAPAKEISVYDYSIVLFAALWGFLFLDQLPDVYSILGYVIIIGAAAWKWYYAKQRVAQ